MKRSRSKQPLSAEEQADILHFLPGLTTGYETTTSIGQKTSISSSSVWLVATKAGYRYIREGQNKANWYWSGPDTRTRDQQEHKTMNQEEANDWTVSLTDYEALMKPQAHEEIHEPTFDHAIETASQPEDEMIAALDDARASVTEAARTITAVREDYQARLAALRDDWENEVTTLRLAHDAARKEADTYKQDALRWRDRRYQDTLHKRQMSVGLLKKGTAELRKLLNGEPDNVAYLDTKEKP